MGRFFAGTPHFGTSSLAEGIFGGLEKTPWDRKMGHGTNWRKFHHFSPFFVTPFSPIISPFSPLISPFFVTSTASQVAKAFLFFFHKSSEIAPHTKLE